MSPVLASSDNLPNDWHLKACRTAKEYVILLMGTVMSREGQVSGVPSRVLNTYISGKRRRRSNQFQGL